MEEMAWSDRRPEVTVGTRDRARAFVGVISNDPDILQGQTVFAGTRVPLDVLEAYRMEGGSLDEFLENYPTVERWQAEAAWAWDAATLRQLIRRGANPTG